jgi:hypothetical protein
VSSTQPVLLSVGVWTFDSRLDESAKSSSTSSSSSIDDALIQLNQQQNQQRIPSHRLFTDETLSIFHLPKKQTIVDNQQQQERAVHDNIQFLASMAAASTPITEENHWSPNGTPHRTTHIQEATKTLHELCDRGFDELNTLIQEQRLVRQRLVSRHCPSSSASLQVQSYLNVNISSKSSTSGHLLGTNSATATFFIVPEYLIFKCKKVEATVRERLLKACGSMHHCP